MRVDLTNEEILEVCGGRVPQTVKDRFEKIVAGVLNNTFNGNLSGADQLTSQFLRCSDLVESGNAWVVSENISFDMWDSMTLDFSVRTGKNSWSGCDSL